jgi:hypothetical protein
MANAIASPEAAESFRFSLKKLFVFFAIVCVLFAAATWSIGFARRIMDTPQECYATMEAAEAFIDYMRANGDDWPQNWEDLRAPFAVIYQRGENSLTFEELKERIDIDFSVDTARLREVGAQSGSNQAKMIRLRSGRQIYWEGAEPNETILKYLNRRPNSL